MIAGHLFICSSCTFMCVQTIDTLFELKPDVGSTQRPIIFFCFSSLPLYSIHHLIQVQKWWWHGQIYNKAWNWFIKLSALSLHLSTSFLSIGCAVELCYVFQNGCPQTETGWTMHYGKGFGLFTGDQISGLCEQPLASRLFFFVCGTRESNIILWETNSWLIYGSFASSARVKVLW